VNNGFCWSVTCKGTNTNVQAKKKKTAVPHSIFSTPNFNVICKGILTSYSQNERNYQMLDQWNTLVHRLQTRGVRCCRNHCLPWCFYISVNIDGCPCYGSNFEVENIFSIHKVAFSVITLSYYRNKNCHLPGTARNLYTAEHPHPTLVTTNCTRCIIE
jgi:hypothetical protein